MVGQNQAVVAEIVSRVATKMILLFMGIPFDTVVVI